MARHGRVAKGSSVAIVAWERSSNDMEPFQLVKDELFDAIDVGWAIDAIENSVTMLVAVCWLWTKPSHRPPRRRVEQRRWWMPKMDFAGEGIVSVVVDDARRARSSELLQRSRPSLPPQDSSAPSHPRCDSV